MAGDRHVPDGTRDDDSYYMTQRRGKKLLVAICNDKKGKTRGLDSDVRGCFHAESTIHPSVIIDFFKKIFSRQFLPTDRKSVV